VESVLLGAVYGISLRAILQIAPHLRNSNAPLAAVYVMTVGFLFIGPVVLGFLVIERAGRYGAVPVWQWFALPSLAVLLTCAAAMLLLLEGAICIVFALPIMLVASIIGGITAGFVQRRNFRVSASTTYCLAVIPVLIASAEARFLPSNHTRTVSTEIRIHAPASVVWDNIKTVPAIAPSELRPNWTHRIGFPRPIKATLSYEGVGGIRHATFERGVLFIETVTAWEPNNRLAFSIRADSANIPSTTLDEHVTIGGRYFDVLDGEYRLEPLASGDILLHLTSHQRLSTDFNGYAGLWTDAVMQSVQTGILEVIQHRCEAVKNNVRFLPENRLSSP
jgi:hypothetical protein